MSLSKMKGQWAGGKGFEAFLTKTAKFNLNVESLNKSFKSRI
jgi:uncharacterized protein YukE